MAILNRDTPLATSPEPRFTAVKDTVKEKISPYMQKRAAQDLVKQKNIRARDSILNRNANAQGKTREEVRAKQEKDKKKPNADPYCGQANGFTKDDPRGSCTKGNYYSTE